MIARLLRKFGYVKAPGKRGFDGAQVGRLTADWLLSDLSADDEIRANLRVLRLRCRDLERNNDYARCFLGELQQNVLGSEGLKLQMKVQHASGEPDIFANRTIRAAWLEWGLEENCTIDGETNLHELDQLMLRGAARDGESLLRMIRTADSAFGFTVQLIEPDCLDHELDTELRDGGQIRMGVEYDASGRRVAYHLFPKAPNDLRITRRDRIRVPARDIIHLGVRERPSQSRYLPWFISVITRLRHLGKYEEAELIASRVAAAKMGFFEQQAPEDYTGDDTDADGNLITEAEPGAFERLAPGVSFKAWDPSHPNGNYDGFRRGMLRGVAAGLSLAFPTLSKDSSDINFSTLRSLLLNERDSWMMLQGWFIRKQRRRLFTAWLEAAMLAGKVKLPFAQFAKYNAPVWIGRRWKWVDPMKDVNAALLEINNGLSSRRAKIAEGGGDIDEVFDDLANDMDLAATYNLNFGDPKDGLTPATAPEVEDDEEEEDDGPPPDDKAA